MPKEFPLISCSCVTRNDARKVSRIIECFTHQTYPNKELIILTKTDGAASIGNPLYKQQENIKVFAVPDQPKLLLGTLRNMTVEMASGEYICQWDDDDWYHNNRLEVQMEAILRSHKPACLLTHLLMFDQVHNRAFLSSLGLWGASLFCEKRLFESRVKYPNLNHHEDSHIVEQLISLNCIFPIVMPILYIYAYHGNNTFDKGHFERLHSRSQVLSPVIVDLFNKIYEGTISNDGASHTLSSSCVLGELNYFHSGTI